MPILVECDSCAKKYQISEDKAGLSFKCKSCGEVVQVPFDDDHSSNVSRKRESSRRSLERAKTGKKKKRKKSNLSTGLIVGGTATLAVLIGLGIFFILGDSDVPPAADNNTAVAENPQPVNAVAPQGTDAQPAGSNVQPPAKTLEAFAGNPNATGVTTEPEANLQANAIATPEANPVKSFQERTTPELVGEWKAGIDPPDYEIHVEPVREDLSLQIGDKFSRIFFPYGWSDFVGFVGKFAESRTIVNVRTGDYINISSRRVGGTFPGNEEHEDLTLDGKYYTCYASHLFEQSIDIHPLDNSTPPVGITTDLWVANVRNAGSKRVVVFGHHNDVYTWKIPGGEPEHQIKLLDRIQMECVAFSPNGKYMAVIDSNDTQLWIYDLEMATISAIIALPIRENGGGYFCDAIAFSPDGSELAAFFTGWPPRGPEMMCWNMENGQLLLNLPVSKDYGYGQHARGLAYSRILEWFPDKSKWLLYGQFVFDRSHSEPLWVQEKGRVDFHVVLTSRLLSPHQVLLPVAHEFVTTTLGPVDISKAVGAPEEDGK